MDSAERTMFHKTNIQSNKLVSCYINFAPSQTNRRISVAYNSCRILKLINIYYETGLKKGNDLTLYESISVRLVEDLEEDGDDDVISIVKKSLFIEVLEESM